MYRSFSPAAFVIAGICSTLIPFLISSRILHQQRIIQEKNRQLQSLANQLREANAELSERNVQLDAFSHTVAHDLQTPLGALTGLSRLLEENYTKFSAPIVRQHLRTIGHTTEKLSHIVDELLLLSQIEESDVLCAERLNMATIVGEAIEYLVLMIEEYRAEIVVPERWPDSMGHAPWVQQLWINYISNALKYGGRPPAIQLGATVQQDTVRFWIQDNGLGLTPEEQKELFVPHKRLHETRAKGHGLGLSIARNIAERLGGEAGVESRGVSGEGCRFYFTLPRPSTPEQVKCSELEQIEKNRRVMQRSRAKDLAAL
jgi:signal transduction histidine kinase